MISAKKTATTPTVSPFLRDENIIKHRKWEKKSQNSFIKLPIISCTVRKALADLALHDG